MEQALLFGMDTHMVRIATEDAELTARQVNILRSPKKNGNAHDDSASYLAELGVEILDRRQAIQFLPNCAEPVHRWSSYVQGFSAKFVQGPLDALRREYPSPVVLDPFAGSGTVAVQCKLNGYEVYGIELNPLLHFVAETKTSSWNTCPDELRKVARRALKRCSLTRPFRARCDSPGFLKSERHFRPPILRNLEKLKAAIDNFDPASIQDKQVKDLMDLAFAAILIDCSNLKRTPCLGYSRSKVVADGAPYRLFADKIEQIASDLEILQTKYAKCIASPCKILLANSMDYEHTVAYDLAITSPPYMNGLDYVMNYKIEMGWLGFAQDHRALKQVKDEMVVCDNVSKGLIRRFAEDGERYSNEWIETIKENIAHNIERRGSYRRADMPEIVHKYFDDMHKVMQRVACSLKRGGRFILVVGDSLIADVYVPTDLILAKIGTEMGLSIERIEKARNRRSGQIRTYQLRETIVTLRKG